MVASVPRSDKGSTNASSNEIKSAVSDRTRSKTVVALKGGSSQIIKDENAQNVTRLIGIQDTENAKNRKRLVSLQYLGDVSLALGFGMSFFPKEF